MFFERHEGGERAVLVHLEGLDEQRREDPQEFLELVRSAGAENAAFMTIPRHQPTPRFLIGSGKVEELRALVKANEGDVVIFNHTLTPSQERNLERELECRVIDRTGLILDIFAQRARTHEGKLQVELAQLDHLSTRLVRGWTHLERQKGGIGLRGPGETQLETDRRLLRVRIKQITRRLEKVRSQRDQARRARRRAEIPVVSLVGYTNAGKSTLFNTLTSSDVYAADQLFATLDPTLRRIELQDIGPVILADTVGFIRHLPHKLVEAFRATLEEVTAADIIVHVRDISHEATDAQARDVRQILADLGVSEEAGEGPPVIEAWNKIDKIDPDDPEYARIMPPLPENVCAISAETGAGVDILVNLIAKTLSEGYKCEQITIAASDGKRMAWLHENGRVLSSEQQADELVLEVEMSPRNWGRYDALD